MKLICDIDSFKVVQIEFSHKIPRILMSRILMSRILIPRILNLQLEKAGLLDFLNDTLNTLYKSLILSRMNKNGRIILIIFNNDLNTIKEHERNMEFLIKIHGILIRQNSAWA